MTQQVPAVPPWLSTLAANKAPLAWTLFGITIVLGALSGIAGWKFGADYWPVVVWPASISLVCFGCAIYQALRERSHDEVDITRTLVLIVGGSSGLLTSLAGVGLAWIWQDTVLGGASEWQGDKRQQIWYIIGLIVAGFAIMFVIAQLVRGGEHSNPWLRRVLAAYNVGLSALLLLSILIGLNVMVYSKWGPFPLLNKDYNWVSASIYSLSSRSENILEGLKEPTKIIVLMPRGDAYQAARALLDNCQSVNKSIETEVISPDQEPNRVDELMKQYKFSDREGMLILYGKEPKIESRFIRVDELISAPDFSRSKASIFKGEAALINELNSLIDGKKATVYFTQGNGELDLDNTRVTNRVDEGLGLLKQSLERRCTVKGLKFSDVEGMQSSEGNTVVAKDVPADADVLLIVGPQKKFSEFAVRAIRDYLKPSDPSKRRGRLIAMLDVVANGDRMEEIGIEPIIRDAGIDVGNDRIISLANLNRSVVIVATSQSNRTPLASAFKSQDFVMFSARTMKPAQNPANKSLQTATLLETLVDNACWADPDVGKDPGTIIAGMTRPQLQAKFSKEPIPVACTVSESGSVPDDPAHAGVSKDSAPRMVVFGDATWVSNRLIGDSREGGTKNADLVASCISWLREKPHDIGIEPKKSDVFMLENRKPETYWSLIWMPAILMLVGIVGLGASVWVVRRR